MRSTRRHLLKGLLGLPLALIPLRPSRGELPEAANETDSAWDVIVARPHDYRDYDGVFGRVATMTTSSSSSIVYWDYHASRWIDA